MRRNYFISLIFIISGCFSQGNPSPDLSDQKDGGPKVEKYLTGGVLPGNLKFQQSILIPTDDDQALAETVRTGERVLSDRSKFLHEVLSQYRPRVFADSTNGTEISFSAAPITLYDPTTDPGNPIWHQFRVSTPTVITPAGLVDHAHYYVYAINNAGNVDFQVTLSPPDSQLLFKGGDTAFRYLFSFRTNTSNNQITPFTYENGKMRFLANVIDISPGAGVSATIDVQLYAPPTARKAIIESTLSNVDPAAGIFILFRPFGVALNENIQHSGPAMAGPITNTTSDYIEQSLISQKFDVSINGATLLRWGAGVAGWIEY